MAIALTILVFTATFLVASLAVFSVAFLQSRRSTEPAAVAEDVAETPLLLREESLSTIAFFQELLKRVNFVLILKDRISDAGLTWSVGRVVATSLLAGALGVVAFGEIHWLPPGTSLVAGAGALSLPYVFISLRRKRRFSKLEEQFPDALDSLCRALRAGHPFASGFEMLAYECAEPIGSAFRKTYEEWRLGMPWNQALENLARRAPILEMRLFAAAVTLQLKTGGKLTEVLERLAQTIREAAALRGDVRSISAHGRLTGLILTILPVAIAGIMFTTSPGYFSILFQHPNGPYLIGGAVACLVAGHLVIQRIVDVKP